MDFDFNDDSDFFDDYGNSDFLIESEDDVFKEKKGQKQIIKNPESQKQTIQENENKNNNKKETKTKNDEDKHQTKNEKQNFEIEDEEDEENLAFLNLINEKPNTQTGNKNVDDKAKPNIAKTGMKRRPINANNRKKIQINFDSIKADNTESDEKSDKADADNIKQTKRENDKNNDKEKEKSKEDSPEEKKEAINNQKEIKSKTENIENDTPKVGNTNSNKPKEIKKKVDSPTQKKKRPPIRIKFPDKLDLDALINEEFPNTKINDDDKSNSDSNSSKKKKDQNFKNSIHGVEREATQTSLSLLEVRLTKYLNNAISALIESFTFELKNIFKKNDKVNATIDNFLSGFNADLRNEIKFNIGSSDISNIEIPYSELDDLEVDLPLFYKNKKANKLNQSLFNADVPHLLKCVMESKASINNSLTKGADSISKESNSRDVLFSKKKKELRNLRKKISSYNRKEYDSELYLNEINNQRESIDIYRKFVSQRIDEYKIKNEKFKYRNDEIMKLRNKIDKIKKELFDNTYNTKQRNIVNKIKHVIAENEDIMRYGIVLTNSYSGRRMPPYSPPRSVGSLTPPRSPFFDSDINPNISVQSFYASDPNHPISPEEDLIDPIIPNKQITIPAYG